MSLDSGTRIGPYEILSALGAGGMGEVYRATDTILKRQVAIKVLPASVAADGDRLARFQREAEVLAALNHPNIAHIFGVEKSERTFALVMELVEGPTLADRIAQGPIAPADAVPIAKQIAEALEAAHDQGIIHRDLKPANIKVRDDGTVKVLDFGLAKALDRAAVAAVDVTSSPTFAGATQAGVIIGTAAYMAPEQARGKAVDKRADIWAFGVVIYEMLAGRRAFAGEDLSDVLAAVLRQELDWTALPAATPPALRRMLARCLDRDARSRLRDIGEARVELARLAAGTPETPPAVTPAAAAMPAPRSRLPWIALPIVGIVAAFAAWSLKPAATAAPLRLSIALPAGEQMTTVPAISRDGRMVAYAAGHTAATSQLYLRSLEDFSARAVPGSGGAVYPFFSPDGRSIAFFAGGKLQRAPVAGGSPATIAITPSSWGGTWGDDDRIIFSGLSGGLQGVPASGGKPEQLSRPDGAEGGYAHVFPQRLPGTTDLLAAFWGRQTWQARFSLKTGTWQPIITNANLGNNGVNAGGTYAGGYLLINDGVGGIRAAAWTPAATTLVRPETVVIENVNWTPGVERPWLNVADNGTAVYVPGNPRHSQITFVDRQGQAMQLPGDEAAASFASVSPDGRRVAFGNTNGLWVIDLASGASTRILTDKIMLAGCWMPDNQRLVVSSNVSGDWDLYTVGTNGHSELQPLLKKAFVQHPLDTAPDGTLVYFERNPVSGSDLWTLSPDGRTAPLATSTFNESGARVSPDGRYVAYASDESGLNEVYAVALSGKGERFPISIDGGTGPVWSRDGRELFYRAGDDLVAVQVKTTPSLVLGERRKLLDLSSYDSGYVHEFDVSADGRQFLLIRRAPAFRPTRLNVMINWLAELKARVPAQ